MDHRWEHQEQAFLRHHLTMLKCSRDRIKNFWRGRGLILAEWWWRRGLKWNTVMSLKSDGGCIVQTNFRLWAREGRESHQPGLALFQEILTQETCSETSCHRSGHGSHRHEDSAGCCDISQRRPNQPTTSISYRFSMQGHHVMLFFYFSWCTETLFIVQGCTQRSDTTTTRGGDKWRPAYAQRDHQTDSDATMKWWFSILVSTHLRQHITFTFTVLSSVYCGIGSKSNLLEPWI
jgi:hypothetical protein